MTLIETLIYLVIASRTTHTEIINCDGTNLICAGQPITCTDNEACLITCTGTDDCVGTTITCPTNGDCTIECHITASSDGCKASSITATNSLSLTIDNQAVARGFQSVPIYCPMNGNCIISATTSNRAFESAQIYSIFGFVFNQVSISCTGGLCNNQMKMHCGNGYNANCIIDPNTGNSCINNGSICDTIFTSITNRWNDDYSINPAPGWSVTDFRDGSINRVFIGSVNTYHGPFYGAANAGSLDTFTLTQHFYCANPSNVYVEYTYGFSCQEDVDYSRLYLNDQLYADKHGNLNSGQIFQDTALQTEVSSQCPNQWETKSLNGSLGEIQANTLFKVQITVTLNYDQEASIITDFHIICYPTNSTLFPSINPTQSPSKYPTNSPTKFPTFQTVHPSKSPSSFPTLFPTHIPSTNPSQNPSKSPSQTPTLLPSKIPTNTPTDATINPTKLPSNQPTLNPSITTLNPTTSPTTYSPTTTANPTTINPTVNPITSMPTTLMPTVSPTVIPTQMTTDIFEGTNDLDEYYTLNRNKVNKEALWIGIVVGVIGSVFIVFILRKGYMHNIKLSRMSGMHQIDTMDNDVVQQQHTLQIEMGGLKYMD